METIKTVRVLELAPAGMTQTDRALETEVAAATAAYREALTLINRAMIKNYLEPKDRAILRQLINPATWQEREFDERLCRRFRFDRDLGFKTWIKGDSVRFEALDELKNLLELTMVVIRSTALSDLQTKAEEERRQRCERDMLALKEWWNGLDPKERDRGLRGVLLRLGISQKEMDTYWEDEHTSIETKIQLMAMAMHVLEAKPRELARDIRTRQGRKPMKRPDHLRLVA